MRKLWVEQTKGVAWIDMTNLMTVFILSRGISYAKVDILTCECGKRVTQSPESKKLVLWEDFCALHTPWQSARLILKFHLYKWDTFWPDSGPNRKVSGSPNRLGLIIWTLWGFKSWKRSCEQLLWYVDIMSTTLVCWNPRKYMQIPDVTCVFLNSFYWNVPALNLGVVILNRE